MHIAFAILRFVQFYYALVCIMTRFFHSPTGCGTILCLSIPRVEEPSDHEKDESTLALGASIYASYKSCVCTYLL